MDIRLIDDVELRKKWFKMSVQEQISNIGGEVNRAINWSNKGNTQRAKSFCNKAIEFVQLSMEDPKNRHRRREVYNCICELEDRFLGDNVFRTTDETLRKYYDAFIYNDFSDR